jgi:hypothetical protein
MNASVAHADGSVRTPGRRWWKHISRGLLLLLTLLTVRATYLAGERLGMETILTARHVYYSLPYAISREYFGTGGYVILRDVAEVFITAHPHVTNATIAKAVRLKPSPDRLMYFPGDDKGDADFAILAFRLFGFRVESLYYAWFALYLAGIVTFSLVYWHHESRLVALCVLTSALYVGFFALPLTSELLSIHNPRAFGAISLVPMLHLGFATLDRHRLTAGRLLAAAMQAAVIAFAVHVRSTEWWQVLALLGLALLAVRRSGFRREALWPSVVLLAALATLDVYQRVSMDREYERTQLRHRTFWHNVGIGFALNPVLAHRYGLTIDDLPMMQLVRRRLVETNRADELLLVFMPAGEENYQFNGIARDYVRYEREARGVVLSIVWNSPWEAVKTFLLDKPRLLAKQLVWATGYSAYSIDDLHLVGQIASIASGRDRADKMIGLNPFRPWVLAGLVVAVWIAGGPASPRPFLELWALSLWMCVVSLLPSMVAYPIISNLGPPLVTISFVVLAGFAWAVARAGATAAPWLTGAAAWRPHPDCADSASLGS